VNRNRFDEEAEEQGDLLMAIITETRREKAEKHLPLNTKLKKMTIYAEKEETAKMIAQGREDIAGTCKIEEIAVLAGVGIGREVKPYDVRLATEYE
jgi:valyl-tRNA synthetase